jgi:hypothetical protein
MIIKYKYEKLQIFYIHKTFERFKRIQGINNFFTALKGEILFIYIPSESPNIIDKDTDMYIE